MKTSLSKFTFVLMALLLCLTTVIPAAFAEEAQTVQINAEITAEGTLPTEAETYVLCMTASDAGNPMPNGQKGGSYELKITDVGKATFPAMQFDQLGIYKYTIAQKSGSYADCTYDERTYDLTVYVVNDENDEMGVEVVLQENGQSEKTDTTLFHNVYKKVQTESGEITKTGVNDMWPYYLGGSVLLLMLALVTIRSLRRREDGSHEGQ